MCTVGTANCRAQHIKKKALISHYTTHKKNTREKRCKSHNINIFKIFIVVHIVVIKAKYNIMVI